jgi:hypothetical protein
MEDQTTSVSCVSSDATHAKRASETTAQQGSGLDAVDIPHTAAADHVVGSQTRASGLGDHQNEQPQIGTSTATKFSGSAEEATVELASDDLSGGDPHARSGDEAYQSDDEREADIRYNLTTELQDHHYQGLSKLTHQRQVGRKRGLQASQFLIAIENRVRELEYEVKRLKGTQDEKYDEVEVVVDVETNLPSKEISAGFLLKPARLTWSDFSLALHLRASKDQSTIDILIERPHSFGQKANPFGVFDGEPPLLPGSWDHRRRRQSGLEQASGPVERVRFNSYHLGQVLEDIIGGDIPLHSPGLLHQLRPFKAIIPYTTELRAKLSEFEELIAKQDETPTNSTDDDKAFQSDPGDDLSTEVIPDEADPKGDRDASEQFPGDVSRHNLVAMRDHTKTLVECFETTLCAEVNSYTNLRSRPVVDQSIKVSFIDLWYLFAPGDLVYDHINGQALRVLSVRGGRPYLVDEVSLPPPPRFDPVVDPVTGQYMATARPQRLKATDMQADFALTCFYLSFNGTNFGPVQRDIIIEPFEGSTAVDSLVVMPIEYAKNSTFSGTQARSGRAGGTEQSLQEILLARGRIYADLASPGEAGI